MDAQATTPAGDMTVEEAREFYARMRQGATTSIGGPARTGGTAPARFDVDRALRALASVQPGEALELALLLRRDWTSGSALAWGRHWIERLTEQVNDPILRSRALYASGSLAFEQGKEEAAMTRMAEALRLAREAQSEQAEAAALHGLARCNLMAGNLGEAINLARQELSILEGLGDEQLTFPPLHVLAYAEYISGDDERARLGFEHTLALARRLRMQRNEAQELTNLGGVETRAGNLERAGELCREAVRLSRAIEARDLLLYALVNAGGVAAARGDLERAARLLGGSIALFDRAGAKLNSGTAVEYERHVTAAVRALGDDRYDQLAAEGAALAEDELVALALGE